MGWYCKSVHFGHVVVPGIAVVAHYQRIVLPFALQVLRAVFRNQQVELAVDPKNDVWALGLIAVEALTGRHPFSQGGAGMGVQGGGLAQVRVIGFIRTLWGCLASAA